MGNHQCATANTHMHVNIKPYVCQTVREREREVGVGRGGRERDPEKRADSKCEGKHNKQKRSKNHKSRALRCHRPSGSITQGNELGYEHRNLPATEVQFLGQRPLKNSRHHNRHHFASSHRNRHCSDTCCEGFHYRFYRVPVRACTYVHAFVIACFKVCHKGQPSTTQFLQNKANSYVPNFGKNKILEGAQ